MFTRSEISILKKALHLAKSCSLAHRQHLGLARIGLGDDDSATCTWVVCISLGPVIDFKVFGEVASRATTYLS
jgi:hypothetical protein